MKPRIVKAWTYNVKEGITRLTQDKGKHLCVYFEPTVVRFIYIIELILKIDIVCLFECTNRD